MIREPNINGFSLIELLVALTITLGLSTVIFQLFRQNERIFRDQYLVMEMQQAARLVVTQISDDVRIAGQGVPVYSAAGDAVPAEASTVIIAGSDATRLNLRAGFSNVESSVLLPNPLDLAQGSTATLVVSNSLLFSNAIGTAPTGKYVYVWGRSMDSTWTWFRASVLSIATATNTIRIATESGNPVPIQFAGPPRISLEEAVAIYRDPATGSIRRASAASMANPASPAWASANELAANVTLLTFTYYDKSGNVVFPTTTSIRNSIARIDARVEIQTAADLSNGSRPRVALSIHCTPRNLERP